MIINVNTQVSYVSMPGVTVRSRWKITHPRDKCLWEIDSDSIAVAFREIAGSEPISSLFCSVGLGSDVDISVRTKGTENFVDATGKCDIKPRVLGACEYAMPDSDSIPGWDIWTISVSASKTSDSSASIALVSQRRATF